MKKYLLSLILIAMSYLAVAQTPAFVRGDTIHFTNKTKNTIAIVEGRLKILRATAGSPTDSVYAKGSDGYLHLIVPAGGGGGSFLPLSGGIMTGKQFFNTTASDSLGVWWGNGAHGVGSDRAGIYISQPTTDHTYFTSHLDDNAHLDFFRWEINTNSSGGPADNHDVVLLNLDRFQVLSDSVLFRNYLHFASGSAGVDSLHIDATHDHYTISHTDLSTGAVDFTGVGSGFANNESDDTDGNFSGIVTNSGNGTKAFMQSFDASSNVKRITVAQDSTANGTPGIYIEDTKDHVGLIGSELFTLSGDPDQYVQVGNLPGGGGNTIYTADDSLISDRVVNLAGHSLEFSDTTGSVMGIYPNVGIVDLVGTNDNAHTNIHSDMQSIAQGASISMSANGTSGKADLQLRVQDTTANGVNKFQILEIKKGNGYFFSNPIDSLGAYYGSDIDTSKSIAAFGDQWIPNKQFNDEHYAAIGSGGSSVWGAITGTLSDQTDLQSALDAKQATLVSGTNIKTINSSSILASGNINLQTPLIAGTDYLAPTGSAAGLTGLTSGQVTTALGFTPVTNARTVTINGVSQDLSANRTYTITTSNTDTTSTGFATRLLINNFLTRASAALTYQPIGSYLTSSSTNTLTNKSGNISQWTNDSGYLTSVDQTASYTWTGKHIFNNSVSGSSPVGAAFTPTLTPSGNNQTSTAITIAPTYSDGSSTGTLHIGLEVDGFAANGKAHGIRIKDLNNSNANLLMGSWEAAGGTYAVGGLWMGNTYTAAPSDANYVMSLADGTGLIINGPGTTNSVYWSVNNSAKGMLSNGGRFVFGSITDDNTNILQLTGNMKLESAGNKLLITEGTNGSVGQTTLVSGTKAITISGLTTSSRAFITLVSQGGTVTTTTSYGAVCTSNTLTITALTAAKATNTSDTSIINYWIIN